MMTLLYPVGIMIGYVANRSWSYQSARPHQAAAPRYVMAYAAGYLVQLLFLTFLHNGFGAPHQFAQFFAIGATAVFLYAALNYWVFPKEGASAQLSFRNVGAPIILFLTVVLLRIIAQWDFIFSPGLVSDDLLVFQSLSTDDPAIPKSIPVLALVLRSLTGWLETPEAVRVALTALHGIAAIQIYFLLRFTGLGSSARFLIAALAVGNPITPSLPIFINGVHPLLGGVFALAGLVATMELANSDQGRRAVVFAALAIVLYLLGIYSSPSVVLISVIGLFSPLAFPQSMRRPQILILLALVAAAPIIIYFLVPAIASQFEYHYAATSGFTVISASNIVKQTMAALQLVVDAFALPSTASSAYVAIAVCFIFFVFALRGWRALRSAPTSFLNAIGAALLLFGAGGLAFGPASIVTFMLDRYLAMPAILMIAGCAAMICVMGRYSRVLEVTGFVVGAVGIIFSAYALKIRTYEDYKENFDFQNAIATALRAEASNWETGAQIIIATNVPPRFTSSYPHWSTGFVRYASGRRDVFGLIGGATLTRDYPFLGEFDAADASFGQGEKFWAIDDSGARRKQMVGLMRNHPVYAYEFVDDALQSKDIQITISQKNQYQYFFARAGDRFTEIRGKDLDGEKCPVVFGPNGVMRLAYRVSDFPDMNNSSSKGGLLPPDEAANFLASPVSLGSDVEASIALPIMGVSGGKLNMALTGLDTNLRAGQKFGPTYPPMPLLWGKEFRIDQFSAQAYGVTLNGIRKNFRFAPSETFVLTLTWKRGCFLGYAVNGGPFEYSFLSTDPSSTVYVGRGYFDRRWAGEVSRISGVVHGVNGEAGALDEDVLSVIRKEN